MNSEPTAADGDDWISEDEAHRLLARAVELDARDRDAISVKELQEAARQAGIAPGAFARALSELKAGTLGPPTIGQTISAKLGSFRRAAGALAFFGAAIVTPGDAVILTIVSSLGLYAAYEGAIALARLLGQHSPPRVPPPSQRRAEIAERTRARDQNGDDVGARFTAIGRGRLHMTSPGATMAL